MRRSVAIAVLLLPLTIAIAAGVMGIEVSSRDDSNYLTELADRSAYTPTLDVLSWMVLSIGTSAAGVSSLGLRIVGLAVGALTVLVLLRRPTGSAMVSLFVVSVLPLYVNIYFNQLRLAVALLIFAWLISSERARALAIPTSALAHSSFLLFLFPPLALLIPFGLEIGSHLDAESTAALKIVAYLQGNMDPMPWYLGWELVGIACILAAGRRWRCVLEITAVIVAVRLISSDFSLDIGRRVLEIAMLAYSPFFLAIQRDYKPQVWLVRYFIVLGAIQVAMSLYSGVIRIE
jgi:hypothetical protein